MELAAIIILFCKTFSHGSFHKIIVFTVVTLNYLRVSCLMGESVIISKYLL